MKTATHADRPDLLAQFESMESGAFPTFMLHDSVWNNHWPLILDAFPELQLYVIDEDTLAGVANTVPIAWDGSIDDLPASEHDVLSRALRDRDEDRTPNTLVAIQVAVADAYAGTDATRFAIQQAKGLCADRGIDHLIAPVRPTLKHLYPTIEFARYIDWHRPDGLPFDPWIRTQIRGGARRLAVCAEPMTFEGTVGDWESWTGLTLPESGDYVIDGALELLSVDVEADHGRLKELNVWYCYDITAEEALR